GGVHFAEVRFQIRQRLIQDRFRQCLGLVHLVQTAIEQGLELFANLGLDLRVEVNQFVVRQFVRNLFGGRLDVAAPVRQDRLSRAEKGFDVGGRLGGGETSTDVLKSLPAESHIATKIGDGVKNSAVGVAQPLQHHAVEL